jgi:flagellar biosynthetic protein FliQ
MNIDVAIELVRRAVVMALSVAAPLLLTSLIVGVVVSLIQTITQIQEQTLTFIPKILALGVVFTLALPWIASRLVQYLTGAINNVSTLVF